MSAPRFTPGPWRWEINRKHRAVQLCGGDPKSGFGAYDHTVMSFERWGMQGAQPRFLDPTCNLLEPADDYAVAITGREHHAHWLMTINHPNANLIAAAPNLFAAVQALLSEKLSDPKEHPPAHRQPGRSLHAARPAAPLQRLPRRVACPGESWCRPHLPRPASHDRQGRRREQWNAQRHPGRAAAQIAFHGALLFGAGR